MPLYRWVQKVLDGYEANLLFSPIFEGLNLPFSWMDFQIMGLIWKVVVRSLICRHFVKLSLTITENWVDKEDASTPLLFNERRAAVNKSGVDASYLWTQFSVTARLSFTKCRQIKDRTTTFQMSPLTWKSIEEHGRFRPSNIGEISKFAS